MFPDMAWTEPPKDKSAVDEAGRLLARMGELTFRKEKSEGHVTGQQLLQAIDLVDQWRSSHAYPLNIFQNWLRKKAIEIDPNSIVAQRLKRFPTIRDKLRRLKWLQLSEMQDIGGCRAVVSSVALVNKLVQRYKDSDLKHDIVRENDYIEQPKPSGYRSHHLIYRYYSDKKETFNGLQIELQFRTTLQHTWATAVETASTFTGQALKSSRGEKEWLRFFALMGTYIALEENGTPVPHTPTGVHELSGELRDHVHKLNVYEVLEAYGSALREIENLGQKAHYYLLTLDAQAHQISIKGYRISELPAATVEYSKVEQDVVEPGRDTQAVLVSASSIDALRRAYPNYFLNTQSFLEQVRHATS